MSVKGAILAKLYLLTYLFVPNTKTKPLKKTTTVGYQLTLCQQKLCSSVLKVKLSLR